MLTLGFVWSGGRKHLACAASHLTAFMGSRGGLGTQFTVNAVHPIDDLGSIGVGEPASHGPHPVPLSSPPPPGTPLHTHSLPIMLHTPLLVVPSSPSPCPWSQMVLDPSNMRPVLACVGIAAALLTLLLVAHNLKLDNGRERRQRLYCKHGSFDSALTLAEVPKDVSLRCMARAMGTWLGLFEWVSTPVPLSLCFLPPFLPPPLSLTHTLTHTWVHSPLLLKPYSLAPSQVTA